MHLNIVNCDCTEISVLMLSLPKYLVFSVAEAYRPDPPSPTGVNFHCCLSEMWFDSNALEMMTAEHYMYFRKLLVCSMWYTSGEFNHNKATTSQIYKSWSLHYSNSTRT